MKGTDTGKSLAEIAFAALQAHAWPDGIEPNLDSSASFDPDVYSYPHGTHLAAMEVDTETGAVKIRKYVAVDDIGKVVNPMIVEGQVHGGLTQGIAQALFEEAVYDENGTLTTGSFVDYLVPDGTRPDRLRHRPDRVAGGEQRARGQGGRRGGHDRVDPGHRQRDPRRVAAARRDRHRDAVYADAGLEGHPGGGADE